MENKIKLQNCVGFFCAYESTSGQFTHIMKWMFFFFLGGGEGAQILNTSTPLTTPIIIHTPCFYKPFNTNYYYFTKRRKQQKKQCVYRRTIVSFVKASCTRDTLPLVTPQKKDIYKYCTFPTTKLLHFFCLSGRPRSSRF